MIVCRESDIPVARAYLDRHADGKQEVIRALLEVWAAEVPDDSCFNWQYREMEYIDNVLPGTRSCREA